MDISTLREITPEEFAGSYLFLYDRKMGRVSIHPPNNTDYDKISWLGDPITTYFSLKTFTFFDDTGVALCSTYERNPETHEYRHVLSCLHLAAITSIMN